MGLKKFLWVVVLVEAFIGPVCGDRYVYMDSPTACGQTFVAGEREVFTVKPRGSVGVKNPPLNCVVTFQSSHSSSNYKFEIVVESVTFNDCSMTLSVFNGQSVGGNFQKMLGCSTTSSTGHIYPKDRDFTLQLSRTRDQYVYGNDFQLRVQLYYDTEGPDEVTGTSQFPVGGIIGVVLGIVVLIAATILLAWCYKTGRLPGVDSYSYPNTATKTSTQNLSQSQCDGNDGFVSWHNTETKSVTTDTRSNFDLSDTRVWDSLTNITTPRKDYNIKRVNPPTVPNAASRTANQTGRFDRLNTKQLSNSPNTRLRGRGRDYYDDKDDDYDTMNEINDNIARKRGPSESADLMKERVDIGKSRDGKSTGAFTSTDKEEKKTQDFATELQAAIRKASLKRQKSENQTDSDGQGARSSEGFESSVFDSTSAINDKDIDKDKSGPDAESSPKPKKKKRKNSKERKSPKSPRKNKSGDGDAEDSPKKSPRAKSRKSMNIEADENVPPETYAPIFSGDDEPSTSMDYSYQYQPGYQGNIPGAAPFDPRYPMGVYQPGMPGMYPPGMPYQHAGQAQWYVEANPNGQHKMAFAVQTHSQSDDSLQGGAPNFTSTPYTPAYNSAPNQSALVPAGTILDDPQVPQPGTSLMRYDDNPLTGVKTSQVIWTDAKKDPTDPPPDSATQITRKTITRITTKSTEDQLTDAPDPSLRDMSWRAAQQIQATGGQEPAFMSPTRGPMYHTNAIQYATETPERSNASFYMGAQRPVV